MSTARRMMMRSKKEDDPYKDWVKFSIRNYNDTKILGCNINYVERMIVDGVEVTPAVYYDFGDTSYHNVFVQFQDNKIAENSTMTGNYKLQYIDIPSNYVNIGNNGIRGAGASQRCDIAIRATTMPTFGQYNWLGQTQTHLYVPSDLMSNYQSISGIPASRIHPLEEFPHSW